MIRIGKRTLKKPIIWAEIYEAETAGHTVGDCFSLGDIMFAKR